MVRKLAILLDLDGTLVDTVPFILASVRHAFDGRPGPTDAEWIAGIGQPLRVQLARHARSPDDLDALVARYRAHQRLHHDRLTQPFPGAVEAVRALAGAGHAVAVVTGKLAEPAARTLAHVGLAPLVDALVGADSCPRHKPDPEPVLLALSRLGAGPGDAVFAGDSPVDVAAGRSAGVVTAGATWGAPDRAALLAAAPSHLLDAPADLVALAARLAG
ncbi:MAG TPA: HAD hydrolase-like protein [Anaeromyxobacteraceae bacterium]|nr:HAD hydrolase-like protein [Anaeromyxobacteraceae bacterium]